MVSRAVTTLAATLRAGEVLSSGEEQPFREVVAGPGERRVLRGELPDAGAPGSGVPRRTGAGRGRRSLVHLAHVSDLQLADVQSPGRFEFLEQLRGLRGTGSFVPAQRPQEALLAHALDSMVRTLARCESDETGAPVDLVVSTGDNLDNAQWNELSWYLRLFEGGEMDLGGGRAFHGVQSPDWADELFWHPDGGNDRWRTRYGFPTIPGLIERAMKPFMAGGFEVAWLSCFGNHDGLAFGEVIPTAAYRDLVVSSSKARALPPSFDPLEHESDLFERPELFLSGPSVPVPADAARRVIGRREFVEAHSRAGGLPIGHGYSAENLASATTYFVHDAGQQVRLIVLDTANLDGWHNGSIGARQLRWLEERLLACHSGCLDGEGRPMSSGGEDRLVVIASHHGLRNLTNLRQVERGLEDDHPRAGNDEIAALLARFPNIVLWLNGHRHRNEVRFHGSAARGEGAGYVEVTTCSVADWPSQGRLVEIVENGNGTLSVLTTMVNHSGQVARADAGHPGELAALHRELAANVPLGGFGSPLEGTPADRNVEVVLPAPFALGG